MKKQTMIINIVIVLIVFGVFAGGIWAYTFYTDKVNEKPALAWEGLVEIPSGTTTTGIGRILEDEGVIANADTFIWYCKINKFDGRLKAGKYKLDSKMSLEEIATTLLEGREHLVSIMVPPGRRIEETAFDVEKSGVFTAKEFLAACENGDPHGRIPDAYSLEGYLYPETYMVSPSTSVEEFVAIMVDKYFEVMDETALSELKTMGITERDALIIASIVEREAMKDNERPKVAAVFYNRMDQKMRMESCATVIYAIGYVPDELSQQDIETNSPYNTYKVAGLPPGPICSPGEASLEAAIRPANVDYLFFASNGDGTHTFTTSYAEHVAHRRIVEEQQKYNK